MKLVIFDLDQTLVELLPIHNAAMEQVFQEFFGVKARFTEIDYAGRSLLENLMELARLKRVSEAIVREKARKLLERYDERFVENVPQDASRYVLPGVKELLEGLSRRGHMIVLYTGDSARVASKALAATSLAKYFRFCLYGTEVQARADMIGIAIERAGRLAGKPFRGKDVIVIGDSVRDVDAGKQFQTLTIAIATGTHSPEELSQRQPDYLFKDLSDYRRVLDIIG